MVTGAPQRLAAPTRASQPTAARTKRTFSSAPQVRARATSSGAGLVLRAMARAIATSASVGRTVTGKTGRGEGDLLEFGGCAHGRRTGRVSTFPTRTCRPGPRSQFRTSQRPIVWTRDRPVAGSTSRRMRRPVGGDHLRPPEEFRAVLAPGIRSGHRDLCVH